MVAADLLAGAEHDELATAVLIVTSEELATTVLGKLQSQIAGIARGAVARPPLAARGGRTSSRRSPSACTWSGRSGCWTTCGTREQCSPGRPRRSRSATLRLVPATSCPREAAPASRHPWAYT